MWERERERERYYNMSAACRPLPPPLRSPRSPEQQRGSGSDRTGWGWCSCLLPGVAVAACHWMNWLSQCGRASTAEHGLSGSVSSGSQLWPTVGQSGHSVVTEWSHHTDIVCKHSRWGSRPSLLPTRSTGEHGTVWARQWGRRGWGLSTKVRPSVMTL